MALPTFDPEKHHVGIGESDAELFGYMLLPGYTRTGQQSGAPTDFGGQTDLISAPSLSRWTMDDFSGGAYRYSWGRDAAAFAGCLNLVPSKFEPTLRTVPPIVLFRSRNVGGEVPLLAFGCDGYLWTVFPNRVERVDAVTGNVTTPITGYGTLSANTIRAATLDRNSKLLLLLNDSGVIQRHALPSGSLQSSWSATSAIVPAGATAEGIAFAGATILFACSGYLYSLTPPNSGAITDSHFQKLGRLPGLWAGSCISNGIAYVLVKTRDSAPVLMQWVGTSGLLPVCEFPYNFTPEAITTYAGRIFVGGSARDQGDAPKYGALYEVTGASLRLVRNFAPETGASSSSSRPKSIHDLVVHEGLLQFGDTGRGLISYDVTSDGFFGGSQLLPPDGQRQLRKLVSIRDTIYVWITHPLDQAQDGWYKVITAGETATAPYEGLLITSDFSVEPDRDKRWSKFRVLTRYGPATLGYSLEGGAPGGDTFNEIPNVSSTVEQNGDLYTTTFDLSAVPTSPAIRFRIRMPRGQSAIGYTELIAFTASFLFLDTGKWAWQVTVNGTERVEGRDGTKILQDVSDIGSTLRDYWQNRVPVVFRDVDGASYRVQVAGYRESQPIIGPRSHFTDPVTLASDSAQEAFHNLTLVEV